MRTIEDNMRDVNLVREEIVKKINALVSSKSLASKNAHTNKTIINNLRHQISSMSEESALRRA